MIYGPEHGDAMERLFQQAGYATARVTLFASAPQMATDMQFGKDHHLTYSRQNVFLMDTQSFAETALQPPAAKFSAPKSPI